MIQANKLIKGKYCYKAFEIINVDYIVTHKNNVKIIDINNNLTNLYKSNNTFVDDLLDFFILNKTEKEYLLLFFKILIMVCHK